MSKNRAKRYTNAEKRKISSMPHPQETSDPIEYEDNCSCFHISGPPKTGYEDGEDPFPDPKAKNHPYVMKPTGRQKVWKPIIKKDARGANVIWLMDGNERLESDALNARNFMS